MTPPKDRRVTIQSALSECPVGRWVEIGEFSRYMRAAGFRLEVTRDRWGQYICDPQYGSLGYEGYGCWNILQERYLLCLLFEYAAPLGVIDIAYEHPVGARSDFQGQWGTDDLLFLSRYDRLRYFRLTPLGTFVLCRVDHYEAHREARIVSLGVLPNRHIRIDQGDLSSLAMSTVSVCGQGCRGSQIARKPLAYYVILGNLEVEVGFHPPPVTSVDR